MAYERGARIYNLFPRLVGSMDGWTTHLDRVVEMGFDWVYLNPFHYAGFSGSLYAVKDYYAYHPLFVNGHLEATPETQLKSFLDAAHAKGLKVMMDLVINHTAFDSVLATEHPEWFQHDESGALKHPGCMDGDQWVEWGDLVQVDNAGSPEREALWRYWLDMMRHYLALGIDGFRCDAAYHVPSELWQFLTTAVKNEYPSCQFFGETLGCRPWELLEVAESGFDYVFNSVRWWNFEEPWFLEAFGRVVGAAPSVSFPESHDTERLASELDGHEGALKQRLTFAALFATAWMMPIGLEFGFRTRLDVVTTTPEDWETPALDLTGFIGELNALKREHRVFNVDGPIMPVATGNDRVKAYLKSTPDARDKALFIVNLDRDNWQDVHIKSIADAMGTRFVSDCSLEHRWETIGEDMDGGLAPAACQVLVGRLHEEA